MKNGMKKILMGTFLGMAVIGAVAGEFKESSQQSSKQKKAIMIEEAPKPLVNYDYFEDLVKEVKSQRAQKLVNLNTFLREGNKAEKVILDTRSKAMYDQKHVKGAIHLNFSDFTQGSLDSLFAMYKGPNTAIYIYCNNNFYDSNAEQGGFQDPAFISKAVMPIELTQPIIELDAVKSLALNIPTYINLYGYGYKNVFELNEMVDVNDTRIQFEGTRVKK